MDEDSFWRAADAVRRALPRLAARVPDDGLGQGPREYADT